MADHVSKAELQALLALMKARIESMEDQMRRGNLMREDEIKRLAELEALARRAREY